ncbi:MULTISPECIES: enoyl-CoA hydratase-related protein [unclassified Solwaraspora]|uniref:enoyl-CoA hydratase-related protein n=1 Tax=unclassified Solwaraspora TaxID=2627926 RepID=UPI00248CD7C2|nr:MULTISPECIES: enoyl-CoA hydratase-related protein [unclassified Solwaraspora]WBB95959.1 enoyl-CoA hydratase-related protein [Solwaraspora sp. WMMA2059]WBC20137.1 enoyl-CoA hydratase-related protein [Solwaraspora sp. WMMA2080]WJK32276.1 enoyl-CoA hydratase-related protein [Solwaraspora sp. WMMA2065]
MHLTTERDGAVVTVRLHRPAARNALTTALCDELLATLRPLDRDPDIGCFVITGSDGFFSAGADIREMAAMSPVQAMTADLFAGWEEFAAFRTPKIAAVAGYALGGGCELAMMCDLVFAAEDARFGQPEITLGVIPGIGGTQRLTRLVGTAKAMDLILTGRMMPAREAEQCGLVSRIVPADQLLVEARSAAAVIAGHSRLAVTAAREAVQRAQEVGLREGLLFERRVFHGLFATADRAEGMSAFLEKRPARFTGS